MPLQNLTDVELHDSFIDGVRHRRPHIFARQILNAGDLLRIIFGHHDLQLVVH